MNNNPTLPPIQLPVMVECKCGNRAILARSNMEKPLLKCKQCGRVAIPQQMKMRKVATA